MVGVIEAKEHVLQRSSVIPLLAAPRERYRGDSSLDELFVREYLRLVRIAHRVVGQRERAEDVVQEVFFRLSQRPLGAIDDPSAWLSAATVRRALNLLRDEHRRERREERAARLKAALRHGATWDEPSGIIERAETEQSLHAALLAIRPDQAAMLALRYGGCSYSEIASSLHLNAASVGTMLARAERALRKELLRAPNAFRE